MPKPRAFLTVFTFLCIAVMVILNVADQPEPTVSIATASITATAPPPPCLESQDWGEVCEVRCRLGKKVCSEDEKSLICEPLPRGNDAVKSILAMGNQGRYGYADEFFCNTDPDCEDKFCPFDKPVCSKGACFDPMEDPYNCGKLGNKCPKEKSFCARGVCATDPVQHGIPFTAKYSAGRGGKWVDVPPSCIDPTNPTKLLCDPMKIKERIRTSE